MFFVSYRSTHHVDEVMAQGENLQMGEVGQSSTLQSLAGQEVMVQLQSVEERQVSEGLFTQR